ncbi:MAG: hypothetical protein IT242_02170 [Bacteroidia bacterium]|nr:hypothetical protein [Bacteroidia bacterium]
MKLKIVTRILFILCLIAATVSGQGRLSEKIRFSRITEEQGLSQAKVYVTYQDSQGFIWFGTEDGLNKYDGYTFQVYKFDPSNSKSLSNNIVRSIFEDSKNNLWIGTDNGLNIYNRSNGTFERFVNNPANPSSLSNNIISAIAEDKNGTVWFGTSNGLNAFDRNSGKFTVFTNNPSDPSTLSSNTISSLVYDPSGVLWVGTAAAGLNAFDPQSKRCTRYRHVPGNNVSLSEDEVTVLSLDLTGNLWAGTVNGGVNVLNQASGTFAHYTMENGLTSNSVFSVCEDHSGIVWIGTMGGGLHALDRSLGKIFVYVNDPKNLESLSNNKIWNIFEDNALTLWFATSDGVTYFNRTVNKFITYPVSGSADPAANNSVFSIYEDAQGYAWTGVLGGGINVFSRKEGRFVNDRFPILQNPVLKFNNVFSVIVDRNGMIWAGTTDGLITFDRNGGNITQYRNNPSDPSSISNNYIRSIFEDAAGHIWVGTHGGGLNLFDKQTGKFRVFRNNPADSTTLSNDVVMDVIQDPGGKLWVATYGGGLNHLDPATGKCTVYRNILDDDKSISSNYIHCLLLDKSGKLWAGTYGGGVNVRDAEHGSFSHYTENDGLPNNIVNGILEDRKNNMWISTNSGVCRLKPGPASEMSSNNRTYGQQDGLQNKFNENACFDGKDGWMYFGGTKGLNVFHPDSINDNTVVPPLVITRFLLFEKPSKMDTLITSKRSLKLNYKQNFFSFEFSALNYLFPEKNRYAYKMEGLDDEWIYCGSRRHAAFTNIDPGHYVFKLKACNNDGVWNETGIDIDIVITPPFWKTWWFTALAALTITLLIFAYIRIRTNTLVKQNIVLEEKVNLRTHELQEKNVELTKTMDNLKNTQNQLIQSEKMASLGQLTAGIAHEIQNPLNFVNNFSELSVELLNEMDGSPPEEQKEYIGDLKQNLDKIVFHGKRADSIVKGMLQHSRASTAEKQVTDINKLVEEFFNLAYHGMRAKDPGFNCAMEKDLAANLPMTKIIPQDISRVILNIFNNSFYAIDEKKKNQPGTYQPTVSISTRLVDGKIQVKIRDNGKGIPQEVKEKIFNPFFTTKPTGQGTGLGLSISYDIIVKGHNGDIRVDSKPGEFTEFTIILPVNT